MSQEQLATRIVNVHLLPDLANPHETAGYSQVVVDVLRASSTITAALDAGADRVLPCLEVGEARRMAERMAATGPVLLGGERQGKPIAGFDLGNSPSEYRPDRVKGSIVVFTTTNGTRALMRCIGAGRVLIGCFANLSAIVQKLAELPRVEILCAGTDGEVSWEDTLFAGALVSRLRRLDLPLQINDSGSLAEATWHQIRGADLAANGLAEAFRCGQGARNLIAIDRAEDLEWAAVVDRSNLVPELQLADWSIRPVASS